MSRVEQIEGQIEQLSVEELQLLRTWFAEFDAQLWDKQLENGAITGQLDRLADRAIQEAIAGRSTDL